MTAVTTSGAQEVRELIFVFIGGFRADGDAFIRVRQEIIFEVAT